MPTPRDVPDYELALALLPPDERQTVARWLEVLGMEPDEIGCVPPLRTLVVTLAVLRLAADMDLKREPAFIEAAMTLGANGRSLLRNWHRWQQTATRHFVMDDREAA